MNIVGGRDRDVCLFLVAYVSSFVLLVIFIQTSAAKTVAQCRDLGFGVGDALGSVIVAGAKDFV